MSYYKECANKRRVMRQTKVPDMPPKKPPAKKDTKRWCKGKEGQEHDAVCMPHKHCALTREGPETWRVLQCKRCGKILETYWPMTLKAEPLPNWVRPIYFISGHLDLKPVEFDIRYRPQIDAAIAEGAMFVVGDARGADTMAQRYLKERGVVDVWVYHMLDGPRNNTGFRTNGGYRSDDDRDAALTRASDRDIAWVRPGREDSGTAKNLARRKSRCTST